VATDRMRDAAIEAIRQYSADRDPHRIDHTVQVTSFGGSGTTALCDHLAGLGVDLQKGPAHWPFKHQRQPPKAHEVPDGFRVVYLVGDPRDAVLSIFRRRWQLGHYEGMNGEAPGPQARRRLASLDDFLEAGVDDFRLAEHLHGWLGHDPAYPVMFVRYADMVSVWNELCDFVGLGPERPVVGIRPRNSDWRSLPQRQIECLDAMYGDLAAEIAGMPPQQIR
jgi:hypothetical protein